MPEEMKRELRCLIFFDSVIQYIKMLGRYIMDVRVGDELVMKKAHPCGENRFEVLRSGIDFRLRCKKCGREVMVPRVKIEKNIKKIIREEATDDR